MNRTLLEPDERYMEIRSYFFAARVYAKKEPEQHAEVRQVLHVVDRFGFRVCRVHTECTYRAQRQYLIAQICTLGVPPALCLHGQE